MCEVSNPCIHVYICTWNLPVYAHAMLCSASNGVSSIDKLTSQVQMSGTSQTARRDFCAETSSMLEGHTGPQAVPGVNAVPMLDLNVFLACCSHSGWAE
eukprot:jgi/Botrbrau1/15730/Bobra.4_1s0099.1